MRVVTLSPVLLGLSLVSSAAFPKESLDAYIAALQQEVRSGPSVKSSGAVDSSMRPSLDAQRLLQHSNYILHAAAPHQRQQIADALAALAPRYVVPVGISPVPNPEQYLAFTKVQAIFSEILDRATALQRAEWAGNDKGMFEVAIGRLCSAPAIIEFNKRLLDHDIQAGRVPSSAVASAREVRDSLARRAAWYAGVENQSMCRSPSKAQVAP